MRHITKALIAASAVTFGVAHAAPAFGGSGMRLGGGSEDRGQERPTISAVLKNLKKAMTLELSAKASPISDEEYLDGPPSPKSCDKEHQTEVARAESKSEDGGESSGKKKVRGGEPVYLAF